MANRRLGKGLGALIEGDTNDAVVHSVPIENVRPNPDQPRKTFPPEAMEELTESVRQRGIIQPIIGERQADGTVMIIAGERRYRAAQIAQLKTVPVILGNYSSREKLEIALIENVQRLDLNPIEEAQAYHELMRQTGYSQEEVATLLNRSRSVIANALRMLKLPEAMQADVASGTISGSHARTLAGIENEAHRERLFELIKSNTLSVRDTEQIAKGLSAKLGDAAFDQVLNPILAARAAAEAGGDSDEGGSDDGGADAGTGSATSRKKSAKPDDRSAELRDVERQLIDQLGGKVVIQGDNERGRIQIDYYTKEGLEELIAILLRKA